MEWEDDCFDYLREEGVTLYLREWFPRGGLRFIRQSETGMLTMIDVNVKVKKSLRSVGRLVLP